MPALYDCEACATLHTLTVLRQRLYSGESTVYTLNRTGFKESATQKSLHAYRGKRERERARAREREIGE